MLCDKLGERLIFYPNGYLSEFVVPDNVKYIAPSAFDQNLNLKKVTIGKNVIEIGDNAFSWCTFLKVVILPESLLHIRKEAFAGLTYLENFKLPKNLVSIGEMAFNSCSSITKINIPESVTSIGVEAFTYCFRVKEFIVSEDKSFYKSIDGVIFSKDEKTIIDYPTGKMGSYVIPNFVKTIGKSAFKGSPNLTDITRREDLPFCCSSIFKCWN